MRFSFLMMAAATAACLGLTSCALLASDWPDRKQRSPEQMLVDLVRHQQRKSVRASFGELAHECFTWVDYESFKHEDVPARIVARLKNAPDFREIVAALRSLSPERRAGAFVAARGIARPTWRMMGYIDPSGKGNTEAGFQAEEKIAAAVVAAFEQELR
jgi:hypothetical protein